MASISPFSIGRRASPVPHHRPRIWTILALTLACFAGCTMAQPAAAQLPKETLAVDNRVPVKENGVWKFLSPEEHELKLNKRDTKTATVEITVSAATQASLSTRTSTSSAVQSASPLPSPLDGIVTSKFVTDSNGNSPCGTFINTFLNNATFKQCYPLSLLLQGSNSFFDAEASLVSMTQTLDATCAANVVTCSAYFNQLAASMIDNANCGVDFGLGSAVVSQAYEAMLAYQPLYSASCLKDPSTGSYCFANAITNQSSLANVYFYYLPLNLTLPGASAPDCSWCLKQTMAIFQVATSDRRQAIAMTYKPAAQQVNTICGPNFANETLPAETIAKSGAVSNLLVGPQLTLLALPMLVMAFQWLL